LNKQKTPLFAMSLCMVGKKGLEPDFDVSSALVPNDLFRSVEPRIAVAIRA